VQNFPKFASLLGGFALVAFPAAVVNSGLKYMQKMIQLAFMRRLTHHLHRHYTSHRAYYAASTLGGASVRHPTLIRHHPYGPFAPCGGRCILRERVCLSVPDIAGAGSQMSVGCQMRSECPTRAFRTGPPVSLRPQRLLPRFAGLTNADQRITEDVEKFCFAISELYGYTFKPLLDVSIFTRSLARIMGYRVSNWLTGSRSVTLMHECTCMDACLERFIRMQLALAFGLLSCDAAPSNHATSQYPFFVGFRPWKPWLWLHHAVWSAWLLPNCS
jgi:ABC transporter transmembrane region 2